MPAKAAAFGEAHGCRIHASLDDLLADPAVDIVVNLTVQQAHHEVTKRALEAGQHVYSEKPMALRPDEARELIDVAARRGVRLACAPATFLGEAQQTAAAWIRDGRLGPIRAVYADVSHGRIETWHPAPQGFFDVGVLVDVAVYPLTLVTTMVGPRASVRAWGWDLMPDRVTVDGTPFRIGRPDLIVAAVELDGGAVLRLTASSTSAGRPSSAAASSSTATRVVRARQLPGVQRLGRGRSPMTATTRRSPGSASRSPASTGDAGSRTSPRRSPRTGPTARPPSRPPTSSTSSMRRRARWRMRAGRSR